MQKVLLSGQITTESVASVLEMIQRAIQSGESHLVLEINSDGGETSVVAELASNVGAWQNKDVRFEILITNAKSSAALLALSINAERKIRKDAKISLHRGELNLQASDFDSTTGVINNQVLEIFRTYSSALNQVLSKYGLSRNRKLMAVLHGTGWLVLTDKACLRLGIVNEIV